MRSLALVLLLALPASAGEPRREPLAKTHPIRLLIERFHLFPRDETKEERTDEKEPSRERLFHQVGDPDALVTLGDLGGSSAFRLKAAIEVNDVVLRSIAPDGRVEPTDTRQRAPGDYRALDSAGRPYQFRLGARLVW